MGIAYNPRIVTNNLILCLDAGNPRSYPGSGTNWVDVISGSNGTLTNGPTYSSGNGGTISFDGVDDIISSASNLTLGSAFTISLWLKHTNSNPFSEKYFSLGLNKIVIQQNNVSDLNVYLSDGTQQNLWTWGYNTLGNGTLGNSLDSNSGVPITTFSGGTSWRQIACGDRFTFAIKTDGTLWGWGRGNSTNLATSEAISKSTPVTTFSGGTNWKQVSCGVYAAGAIKTDGTLWTWGSNFLYQLAINSSTPLNKSTPITTFLGGTNWKFLSFGENDAVAIKTDGTLWVWGVNNFYQLGTADNNSKISAVTTFSGGTNWKSISIGNYHAAAIKTDGTLWVWGNNNNGQLGINDVTVRSTPVTTFLGGTNWKSVSCADYYTTAVKTDGTLWSWGSNSAGQLGNASTSSVSTPVTTFLGGTNWKSVSSGYRTSSAIKTNGTLWTWGRNGSLQLGNNTGGFGEFRSTPVTTFAGASNWKSVHVGNSHMSVIRFGDATFINDLSSNASILNTTYYNIVVTSNGSTLSLYQNNSLVTSETLNGTLSSTSISYTISDLVDLFKGNLANIQIYNRALTAAEIQQNFNALRGRFGI